MRAARSPLPPDHRECARCAALVPDATAACLCPECLGRLVAADRLVEDARQRQRQRVAAKGGERMIDAVEAAGLLGLTPRHVRRLAAEGKLPVRRVLGRLWIPAAAVERLLHPNSAA